MTGWKQAYTLNYENIVLVKLDIPDDAKLRHVKKYGLTNDSYLCNRARVLSISSFDGKHRLKRARSLRDVNFFYEVGKVVVANKNKELGHHPGIHFFMTREQALAYTY